MQSFALIWDLDGTLVDSYPAIIPAAQKVCADHGLFYSVEEIYSESLRFSVGSFLEKAAAEHGTDSAPLKAIFNELNDTRIDQIQPMPHAAKRPFPQVPTTPAGRAPKLRLHPSRRILPGHPGAHAAGILFHRDRHCAQRLSPQTLAGGDSVSDTEVYAEKGKLLLHRR